MAGEIRVWAPGLRLLALLALYSLKNSWPEPSAATVSSTDPQNNTPHHTEKQFKKLHRFQTEEDEAKLAALREAVGHKRRMMKKKLEALSRETQVFHTVRATEKELRLEDDSFLNSYGALSQFQKLSPTSADILSWRQLKLGTFVSPPCWFIWSQAWNYLE